MNISIDLSDEVSALSMDGASAIAMNRNFSERRLNRDSAINYIVQTRIPEDEERPVATVKVVDGESTQSGNEKEDRTNGKKLIEEFPTASVLWQMRRKKKHLQKSNELGEYCLSSKGGSADESGHCEQIRHKCKSKRRNKKSSKCSKLQEQSEDHEIGESSKTLPTTEISVQSTNVYSTKSEPVTPPLYYARDHERASDSLSFPSAVSSETPLSRHEERCPRVSNHDRDALRIGSTQSFHSSSHEHSSEIQSFPTRLSLSDRESTTITTKHSAHTSGLHSYANQSHVTVEDIHKLHIKLHRAKKEEEQVLRIHEQLVDEVRLAKAQETEAIFRQMRVQLLFEAASLDHQQLQKHLIELNIENKKLSVILSKLEESEDERSFIELMDSMNAKMESYKAKVDN